MHNRRTEISGGLEAALHGFTTSIGPLILFGGILGAASIGAGYWAALVTALAVSAVPLLARGNPSLITGSRVASLALYAGLLLQLCAPAPGMPVTTQQLAVGLAAGSLTLLAAGMIVAACGLLRLGNLFRMIPAPVSTGISNGTALIVLWLGLRQLAHNPWVTTAECAVMVGGYAGWLWLQKRKPLLVQVPAVFVGLLLGILAVWIAGSPAAHANVNSPLQSWNWLGFLLWPNLAGGDWRHLVYLGVPGAATLALVVTLETFTAAAAMEARFGLRVQHNREMVVLGLANMAGGLLGGVPVSAGGARSVPNWLAGGRGPLAYGVSVAVTGIILIAFAPWLVELPAGIMVGLLLMQAHVISDPYTRAWLLGFIRHGRVTGGNDLGFRLVMAISMIGFFGNLIWASFAGVALSSLAVLRRVSRDMTAHWEYLGRYRSRRVRSMAEERLLGMHPHRVAVLRLSGHLFFGNSFRLGQLADEVHADAQAVVIEFSQVLDADASGTAAVERLVRTLAASGRVLVLAGLQSMRAEDLRAALANVTGVVRHADLDRGLEACEDAVLMNATIIAEPMLARGGSANTLMEGLLPDEVTAVLLLAEPRIVAQRDWLFRRGDVSDGVWLIEEGMVNVYAAMDDVSTRLAAFVPGQFVGEMSLVDGKPRSASVRAEVPVRALLLSAANLAALLERHPEAAMKVMGNIARELSARVRSTSALLAPGS